MYRLEEDDAYETSYWKAGNSGAPTSSQDVSVSISHIAGVQVQDENTMNTEFNTWRKTQTSMLENGSEFFQFTQQPNNPVWNGGSCSDFFFDDTDDQSNDEEVIDDSITGKNYDVFETKLKDGYLEASGLSLVCAPPAMFDYRPPLQRLDLKDNKIELLPDNFFDDLPMLNWCDLRYNRLQSLPPMTQEHKNLNVLLVQDNQLEDLPCSLAYAINLHTLGWTNNGIVDPPRYVLLEGCKTTLKYLRDQLAQRLPIDKDGNPIDLPDDSQLEKDLENIKNKGKAKRSTSRSSITSALSTRSSVNLEKEKMLEQKRLDRIKYTWGLWKDIPYHGVNSQTLFNKSFDEIKEDVKKNMNAKKNAILQKIKDNEAVSKWRRDARIMQMRGSLKQYSGMSEPFGTDKDISTDISSDEKYKAVNAETYRSTLQGCMKKLQEFAQNPVPISDTESSLARLKEVEEIQRKLFDMKMKYSVKSNAPI